MKLVSVEDIPKVEDLKEIPEDLLEVYKICKEMQILCEKENGVGLSAVQVGVPWRLFVIKNFEDSAKLWRNFIECDYEGVGEKNLLCLEGCLSLRKDDGSLRHFRVKRHSEVRVTGFELIEEDKPVKVPVDFTVKGGNGDDISFVVFQHEIDHHLGKLISDEGEEVQLWPA